MNWLSNLVWVVGAGIAVVVSYLVDALNAHEWVTAFVAILTWCTVLFYGSKKGWLQP